MAGLLACGVCGRWMESAWSNGKPAYRCRHGRTSAAPPDPGRAKNAYIREDRILAHLPVLHLMLTGFHGRPLVTAHLGFRPVPTGACVAAQWKLLTGRIVPGREGGGGGFR
jgi:hypothetical protein